MRFASDFEDFLRSKVNLNQSRIDQLQQRVNSIEAFLEGSNISEYFLDLIPAGSWAHRTIIRPVGPYDEFDADVLILLTEQPDWHARDYIERTYAAFRASGVYRDLTTKKTRCVRLNYANEFHIDVVPYIERHGQHYVTNRLEPDETGRFELSNPEAFTAWIDSRQRITNGYFIKVVRLMKYLRDFKNTFSCKSIILKTLLGQVVNDIDVLVDPECYRDLPSALLTVTMKLADSLPATMPAVMDPGGTGDNFTDRYKDEWDYANFRACMIRYAERIEAAYRETDRDRSIALWRDIFGSDFKSGLVEKSSSSLSVRASVPWDGEKFIDRPPFSKPVALVPAYSVKVNGRVTGLLVGRVYRKNGFRQFSLTKHGNRVPKNRSIRFTATTTVPAPYEMYWKVRNGGEEAAAVKHLRGEITADGGSGIKVEPTAYAGYHYVECYVVKGGIVVARDRQSVIVT